MTGPRVAILVALLLAACGPSSEPLPEPAAKWPPAPPTITPIPAPDPICIIQMESHSRRSQPRAVFHPSPRFPKRHGPSRFRNPAWVGAAEIDTDGAVTHVRTIRQTDPPWPELEESTIAAVRSWRYEPACVDGHPVKAELTVSVRIEFR